MRCFAGGCARDLAGEKFPAPCGDVLFPTNFNLLMIGQRFPSPCGDVLFPVGCSIVEPQKHVSVPLRGCVVSVSLRNDLWEFHLVSVPLRGCVVSSACGCSGIARWFPSPCGDVLFPAAKLAWAGEGGFRPLAGMCCFGKTNQFLAEPPGEKLFILPRLADIIAWLQKNTKPFIYSMSNFMCE